MPHLAAVGDQQILSSTTDLEAECDRSRGGVRPISVRASTDLAAEPDRSRHRLDTVPDAENKHHPTPTNAPQPAPRFRELNQLIMLARQPIKVSTHPWRRSSAR